MKLIRSLLDKQEQLFAKGSKLEKLYPLHEALDTILYTPGMVTKGTTHVREALDLKRMMIMVAVALMPCIGMAFYNTGYQANLAIGNGAEALDVWQTTVFAALGFAHNHGDFLANVVYGGLFFIPVLFFGFRHGHFVWTSECVYVFVWKWRCASVYMHGRLHMCMCAS